MESVTRITQGISSRWRQRWLRLRGARINGHVWLGRVEVPRQAHRIELNDGTALDRGVTLLISGHSIDGPAIRIGARTYINRHTIIDASNRITIGEDCMIGPFTYITDHDHSRGPDGRPASGPLVAKPVTIGPRVWIGAHVSILKGVTIGEGATVGAGAVVTRDIAPGCTVVGNPPRPIPS
jgi:acetyltransferase-like isoleucine patch superfamily enzyme